MPLVKDLEIKRAVVLMGPRRVGKTVMLYHTVQELINKGINPRKICFITVETPIFNGINLDQLLKYALEASGLKNEEEMYIFFDEIQYLKEWELHLKSLVDSYRNYKFVASGSAAAALKYKSMESGAGRFTDFLLPPLAFCEYMAFQAHESFTKEKNDFDPSNDINELNKHFINYINYGGYPEAVFSKDIQENPGRFIRQDIIDKVLLRDLPSLYGIRDVQELNSLFTMIAYNSGNEFSLEALSQQSGGVSKHQIKIYLEYLESAFLIKMVRRIDQGGKRFQRDNFFKIYLTNPSLRSALFSPLSATDDFIGNMVETAIYAQWMHLLDFTPWYARWASGEVDIAGLNPLTLKPIWAVEIKWSNQFFNSPKKLKSLLKFCHMNKLTNAEVTTIDKSEIKTINNIEIEFVPAAVYAYAIGNSAIRSNHPSKPGIPSR